MKITKQKLIKIIKEELEAALNEEEADCRHLYGKELADCIEQVKDRQRNRGRHSEDLATVVGREMSGAGLKRDQKLDILDKIHSGEITTVEQFRSELEAALNEGDETGCPSEASCPSEDDESDRLLELEKYRKEK